MSVSWTKEQQQVISLRDRNILVSAAAGSGKTAVLVQRILSKITDPEHPIDIDRLLVMTFTRAAAGEMKERIRKALENALFENPEDEHLQRQMTLIHTAQITTIDGFCGYLLRNYFHLIDLDPGYRVGEEGEMKLLCQDVLDELLEAHYAAKTKRFESFVECYASGKTDNGLQELILKLYEAAMSNPFPLEWLEECVSDDILEKVLEAMWENVRDDLQEALALAREARSVCIRPYGPYLYEEALEDDCCMLMEMLQTASREDFDELAAMLEQITYKRLSAKKMPDVDDRLKEQVKSIREEEKKLVREIRDRYFPDSWDNVQKALLYCREPLRELIDLTKEFMEAFSRKKREKNLLDFTDMEHFSLRILLKKEGDQIVMSEAARELSAHFDEVMVDEYQDSNLVQELLTTAVSGWSKGKNNIFMVGDVKQSIYRFRLARPDLFMEKYKSYTLEDSENQRIDLHKNFRSRDKVLESVNYIFRQIMAEDLGGITYDDAAALYPGADYPSEVSSCAAELLLIEKDAEELQDEKEARTAREMEALVIAQRINAMVGKEQVVDKTSGEYRPVGYGDIAILLRTASGWAEDFAEVLADQGIPAYTASKTGYFSAREIVTVLNYLQVCDNPYQDIPLAGVLHSPIVGCTAQEMAMLRSEFPEGRLYESVLAFVGDGQIAVFLEEARELLKEKLSKFLVQLEEFRNMAGYTPVHQLILQILDRTGYGNYAGAMPGGEQRSANLNMLVEKAMEYEKTSYRGLFHFVRYIEQLKKYEVDYGEVNLTGSETGAVQIMTIHKSKGLEFPVVIVAGMGKQFNFQDMNAGLLIHPKLGLGADAILPEKRLMVSTLTKQVIRRELQKESLGEELRVLYVALTRAKEKLIMTGSVSKLEKTLLSMKRFRGRELQKLPLGYRLKAKDFLSYVLPALINHPEMDEMLGRYNIQDDVGKTMPEWNDTSGVSFQVHIVQPMEMMQEEVQRQTSELLQREFLENRDETTVCDEEIRNEIQKRFSYVYPWMRLREIPAKVSVSDLKKHRYESEEEQEAVPVLTITHAKEACVPQFMEQKKETASGSARGTAYHRVMECLDYAKLEPVLSLSDESLCEAVGDQIRQMTKAGKLAKLQADSIREMDICRFLRSDLGSRIRQAALRGALIREQPFVYSVPSSVLNREWPEQETVLVQGIIDAYYIEEKELVLVDYKTDNVSDMEKLRELYQVQLWSYAQALERLTGMKVKECYIYSFKFHKEMLL